MQLLVISDRQITPFCFWTEGEVCDAMQYQGELFRRFGVAPSPDLDSVYRVGLALKQQKVDAIITYSGAQQTSDCDYTLWINLRSAESGPTHLDATRPSTAVNAIASPI